ncbi:hypothetical protein Tco_0115479 [Tanacetum coccineum]
MAALRYRNKHNKVGYLQKPKGSDDYHQVLDFLSASHIRFALTHNPIIFDSLVKQLWSTATLRSHELGPPTILATINETPYSITEDSVRSQLQLADDGGIDDLPIAKIYSGMDNLRFLQTILGIETRITSQYQVLKLSSKLFANMKLNFAGQPMPLLAAMLSQAQAGEGAGVAAQAVPPPIPETIPKTRLEPDQPQNHLSTPPRQQTSNPIALVFEHGQSSDPNIASFSRAHETDDEPFTSTNVEDKPLRGSFHASPPRSTQAPPACHTLGGAEDLITLTALSFVVSTFVYKVNSLEIELKAYKKLFKDVVGKLVKKVKTMEVKLKTKKRKVVVTVTVDSNIPPGGASNNPAASSHIPTDVPTGGDFAPAHSTSPSRDPFKRKGVAKPSSPVSERTKKQLADERLSEIEAARLEALERERSKKEKAKIARQDAIYAKQLEQEVEMSASQRETRQEEVLSSAKHYSDADWIDIMAQVHANAGLSSELLGADVNDDNFAERMVALINQRKRAFAEQTAKEKRDKPMTPAQQREYMRVFVKNQSTTIYSTGWSMKYVKSLTDEQLIAEFEKIRMAVADLKSQELRRTLKRAGEALEPDTSKKQKSTEAPIPSVPDVPQPPVVSSPKSSGTRRKSLGRSRITKPKSILTELDLDADDKTFIKVVSDEDSEDEAPILWSAFAGWEVISTPLGEINALYMMDQSTKHFTTLREILHMVDRQDLLKLYGLVVKYYENHPVAGAGLVLWGDLQVLMDSQAQEGGRFSPCLEPSISWQIRNVSYPLSVEKMLKHKLEIDKDVVGNDMTTAEQLIRSPELGPPAILATIDATPNTITEDSVRSQLQLADDGGIDDLPIVEIYSGMDNLGQQTSDPIVPVFEHSQSSDPNIASFLRVHETVDDPLGGSFHASPPRSTQAPPAGHTSGGIEDLITLTVVSSVVSTLVQKVNSLETELKDTKKLFKDVVGKLVKKVKAIEVKFKTKKRKVVMSDSGLEEGGEQDVDLDALLALANADVIVDSNIPPGGASSSHIPTDVPTGVAPAGVSNKGKTPMVEEEDITVKERTLKQMEDDRLGEEAAKRLHDEEQAQVDRQRAELKRRRQQEVLASAMYYTEADWINIMAKVEANASLSKTLLGDDVTEDNFPVRMAALIKRKKQALAEILAKERMERPMTQVQQRTYMRQFVKNQSSALYSTGWTKAKVESFTDAQLKEEFEKIQKALANTQVQAFSRTLKRTGPELEEPSSKQQKSTESIIPSVPDVPQPPVDSSTKSSGTRRKSLGRNRLTKPKSILKELDLDADDSYSSRVNLQVVIRSHEVVRVLSFGIINLFGRLEVGGSHGIGLLMHKLEINKDVVGNDMTTAEQLIRFIKNQIVAAQVSPV